MNNPIIKVGFCVSYDWELLKKSVPRIYKQADMICLALDKDRKSWAGNPYQFDDAAFYLFVRQIDVDKKITIYEDSFSLPDLNSRENCNRHRMLIAEKMGKGGWHIQIDSDEYFLDFQGFIDQLKRINPNPTGSEKPLNVLACWIPLIKKTDDGFLYVDFGSSIPETAPFATTKPEYLRARHNGHFNYLTSFFVLHETWARGDEDLWFKINNWGHSAEELESKNKRLSYYTLWKSLDSRNYQYVSDFHPAAPHVWPKLSFRQANNVEELLLTMGSPQFPLSKIQLWFRNNRNMARLRSLF